MKRALAAAALALAAPAAAQQDVAALDAAARERVTAAITASGFAGTYAVYAGPRRIAGGSVGAAVPGTPGGFDYQAVWPLASVTKQVVAILVMQEVEAGRLSLDAPASRYLPALAGGPQPTVRQLLQHRAGLRRPDGAPENLSWCLSGRTAPGGAWSYNNCDYQVLGALLERTTRTPLPKLFADRIAGPLGLTAGFIAPQASAPDAAWPGGPTPAERQEIARYGAAGALVGTAVDLVTLDRALLANTLITADARDRMWRGDAALGSMALGQWSFTAPLAGCSAPVRIVERRGAIGRFAVRNLILPNAGMSVVLFTNRGDPDDGPGSFGEIWQGKGISYRVLSAAVCA
ncbi:serine hydrolase domain-containing protein [Sphingomonas sp. 1P08PE]|uniref:serine hydrolase domain-containing protein n=1 Tax=Sphingomonas sp. 1P08PE TaxID=554122 RepID=UPI0039A0E5D2